ncbi:MAG: hypothetical protein KGZ44_08585, partial [Dethiobacter sp.]|nr:hypothetical protein [Dethiobacter sp.]
MAARSFCPRCDFRTEQVLLVCPRCRQTLLHEHCHKCGRCPSPAAAKNREKEGSMPHGKNGDT